MREALELGHKTVGTEHLLLGLLREEHGIGAQVLREGGLDLEVSRAVVLREVSHRTKGKPGSRPHRLVLRVLEWAGLVPRG
jgi:ATP-dependent Clp protease ATP-binding subunit ClpC